MTTTPTTTTPSPDSEKAWRGVAADGQEVSDHVSGLLRDRSRRLLGDLLRPHKRWVWVAIGIVLVEIAHGYEVARDRTSGPLPEPTFPTFV
jgi:ATP-binding cassette subfamily B protein